MRRGDKSGGMTGDELASFIPKPFAKRKPISAARRNEGKVSFIVHLAYTIDNRVHKEGAFIRFIMNQNTGLLE